MYSQNDVFLSFHFDRDFWRVQMVRNMGALTGDQPLSAQEWEGVKRSGDAAVRRWINQHMARKPTVVVLVGAETASRRWVRYEIEQAWSTGKRLLGVRIHGLQDSFQLTDLPGENPFALFSMPGGTLADHVPLHDPVGWNSSLVYGQIKSNLPTWIANARSING